MHPFQGKRFCSFQPGMAFALLSDPGLVYVSPSGKNTLNTYVGGGNNTIYPLPVEGGNDTILLATALFPRIE